MERAADTTLTDPVQPEDAYCARELADAVRHAVATLREPDRRVMTLHHFEEVPTAAIAALTGRSENAVRQQLFRARRRFAANFTRLRSGALAPVFLRLRRWSRRMLPTPVPATAVSVVACAGLLTVVSVGADVARGHHPAQAAAPGVRPLLVLDDDARDLAGHLASVRPPVAGGTAGAAGAPGALAAPGSHMDAPALPFVTREGDPLKGDKPSHERLSIPVGDSEVVVDQYDSNTPGYHLLCTLDVVRCGDR